MRVKTGFIKKCEQCPNKMRVIPYLIKKGYGKFCSFKCRSMGAKKVSSEIKRQAGLKGAISRWGTISYREKKIIVKKNLWTCSKDKTEQLQKKRFRNQRYRARKIFAEGSHTLDDWLLLKALYKYMCLCCKRQEPEIKLTEDHIMPLSMGGSDSIENIQPLCQACNTRKHARFISYLPLSKSLIIEEEGA